MAASWVDTTENQLQIFVATKLPRSCLVGGLAMWALTTESVSAVQLVASKYSLIGDEQRPVTLFDFLAIYLFCAPFPFSVGVFLSVFHLYIRFLLSLILFTYSVALSRSNPVLSASNAVPLSYPIPLRFPHTSGNLTAIILVPLETKLYDQLSGRVIRVD